MRNISYHLFVLTDEVLPQPARGGFYFINPSNFNTNLDVTCRDGNIRYYEFENDALHALSEHKSADPQRGMCFLPRRALSVSDCEIARAYKVVGSGIEPIAFIVPRKVIIFCFLSFVIWRTLMTNAP